MVIDITTPDGNTLVALNIATRMLKKVGADKDEIASLQRAVFSADSAVAARNAITQATNGAITFYDPRVGE